MHFFLSRILLSATLLYTLITPVFGAQYTNTYPDIAADYWGLDAILNLVHHPIGSTLMKGNPDGTFAPDRTLNRAEMAKIATQFNNVIITDQLPFSAVSEFSDITEGEWYTDFVYEAARYKIIQGYQNKDGTPTNTYGPSDPLTIAQAVKILVEVSKLDSREQIPFMYDDVRPDDWFYPYMKKAVGNQILVAGKNIKGEETRYIEPHRPITRGELAALLWKFIDRSLQEDFTSSEQGFTLLFNPSAGYYKNIPHNIELRFPRWFGFIQQDMPARNYFFTEIPESFITFGSKEYYTSLFGSNPEWPTQNAIIEQIARKEINPTLMETVKSSFKLFMPAGSTTVQVSPLTFSQKDGFEQIIYVGNTPNLGDYYLRSFLVKENSIFFSSLPLFPTSLSNYQDLNSTFLSKQATSGFLEQFHFGLLQRLNGNKEALDFLTSSEIKLLMDRVDQYRAFNKSAHLRSN